MKKIIILFNGFGSSSIWWNYAFDNKPILREIDFLDKLKNIGDEIYKINLPFFNLNYYSPPGIGKEKELWKKIYNKYKPYSSNIDFTLEDLDYKKICENVYNKIIEKYGNINYKFIIIGHSYGGGLALLFSKLYKNECILCCCIDNPPYELNFFKKYNYEINNNILNKYSNNNKLKENLNKIKKIKNTNEIDKEIADLYQLISYKSSKDRIKYYDKKLYVPTFFFRAYYKNPKDFQIEWNKYAKKEKKHFEKDKNLIKYFFMNNANHYVWDIKEFSDIIIENIQKEIK